MSHHTTTLQSTCHTIASLYDASLAITDQLLWLDETYFQLFIKWATPRIQDAAVKALIWTVVSIVNLCLWLLDTIERCAAIDAQAIDMMAWAQAHAPDAEVLALAPAAVAVCVTPGHGWQCWLSRQLSPALLLPTVDRAIAVDDDKGRTMDLWDGECNWEYSEVSPSLPPVAVNPQRAISLLPPAKIAQTTEQPAMKKTKKTPAKSSQRQSGKGKSQPSLSVAQTPHNDAQTSRRTPR